MNSSPIKCCLNLELNHTLIKVLSAVPQHCKLARKNYIPSHMVSAGRL